MHMADIADLLTTTEVARELGVDKTTLTRWVAEGRIVAVHKLPNKNGAFLFARADVAALAAERTEAATA